MLRFILLTLVQGLLWLSLSMALLGQDCVNPSYYVHDQINMTDAEAESITALLDDSMKISEMACNTAFVLICCLVLCWYHFRRQIFSRFHYILNMGTMVGLVLGVVVELCSLIVLDQVLTTSGESVQTFQENAQLISIIRVFYGMAISLHEVCGYKLLLQMNDAPGSYTGTMISFALTSRCFKYAFLQILSMNDWISFAQARQYIILFGVLALICVISLLFLEVHQYLQLHHALGQPNNQEKRISKIVRVGSNHFLKSLRKINYRHWCIIGLTLLMAILFQFGVLLVPLGTGGEFWSQYTNSGIKDLIGLRVTINYLIMVTLPFFGACMDHGGKDDAEKKREYRIREVNKEKLLKFSSTKLRLWLLCIGMIVSVSFCYFYVIETPNQVIMYGLSLNIATFIFSSALSLAKCSIYLIPIYLFSKTTKKDIEEKSTILKRLYPNRIQYLYYLQSIFFEQREISGVRYALWFSIIALIRNISVCTSIRSYSSSELIVCSISIYVLSALALSINAAYMLFKSTQSRQKTPIQVDSFVTTEPDSAFDTATFFVRSSTQGPLRIVFSILTWPIDILLSINCFIFLLLLCGVPTLLCFLVETSEDDSRQFTHPIDLVYLPVLFTGFIFTFKFVYPTIFNQFITMHLFRWARFMFNFLFQSPSAVVKSDSNFVYSYSKFSSQLDELVKLRKRHFISRAIKNTVWSEEVPKHHELLVELNTGNENDSNYYEVPSDGNNEKSREADDNFLVITVKDDRTYIQEEKLLDDTERVVIHKFSTKEDYLNYFRAEKFVNTYNERDYYFAPITNGTIIFQKSKFKNNYTDTHALSFVNKHRVSQGTIVGAMSYYMGFFIIPHIFSWLELSSIPTISNPYTFLINSCNFIYGFLMFFPLMAVWLDINYSITSTLKEVILLLQDTHSKIKLFTEKDFPTYDPSKQVRINVSNNRFYQLDHNMVKDWFKKANFLQKTMLAKTELLRNNLILAFVLTKTGSVLLSLISLFTNIRLSPQNFQPMYVVIGLDMSVLFLVIGPCAILFVFFREAMVIMMKMRSKIESAITAYPQDNMTAISNLNSQFMFIEYFTKLRSIESSEMGCSFEVHQYMRVVLDSSMYKAWFYSFLATLPPAILKLVVEKFFTSSGQW